VTLIQTTVFPGLFTSWWVGCARLGPLAIAGPWSHGKLSRSSGRPDATGIVVPAALAANKITPLAVIAE